MAAMLSLVLLGCNSVPEYPKREPVRGTIHYNGQPMIGATITFWPLPLDVSDVSRPRPIAIVQDDGSFQPNSYGDRDGAVVGNYALTVVWRRTRTSPDLFDGKYSRPLSPVATVTISPGENSLPPIDLTGTPLSEDANESERIE